VRYIRIWSISLKETFKIHYNIQENLKFLYFNLFRTVLCESEWISNETSFLSYFVGYKMKSSFSLKETFQIHSKIQENVKFLYFNLYRTVLCESESVSNETNFLSYFVRYMRKSSFSLKETFHIHSKIQENVQFLYFNLFRTVLCESESVSNETSFLSYIVRYMRKSSFS